jgi:hypothetical protein
LTVGSEGTTRVSIATPPPKAVKVATSWLESDLKNLSMMFKRREEGGMNV